MLGPPYTDVRIERPRSLALLDGLPKLAAINLQPPASGPEIELTFATLGALDPDSEDRVRQQVEDATGRPVLAIRQRDGERDWAAEQRVSPPPGEGFEIEGPGWLERTWLWRKWFGIGDEGDASDRPTGVRR